MASLFQKFIALIRHRKQVSTYLAFIEQGNHSYWGSIRPGEVEIIRSLVNKANDFEGPIIEVGALFGYSTQIMAAAKDASKKLIAIDNLSWNPLGLSAGDHLFILERTLYIAQDRFNVQIINDDVGNYYKTYNGDRPSMIFIDADHSYNAVRRDIAWALEQQIPIISGHDFSDEHPGVQKAVTEAFKDNVNVRETVWYVELDYSQ